MIFDSFDSFFDLSNHSSILSFFLSTFHSLFFSFILFLSSIHSFFLPLFFPSILFFLPVWLNFYKIPSRIIFDSFDRFFYSSIHSSILPFNLSSFHSFMHLIVHLPGLLHSHVDENNYNDNNDKKKWYFFLVNYLKQKLIAGDTQYCPFQKNYTAWNQQMEK